MLKLKNAKPIEQLLRAPAGASNAMTDCVSYMHSADGLREDILDRYPYPALWAAIDRLIEFEKKWAKAEIEMCSNGYTYDDAFTLSEYYKKAGATE